MTAHIPTQGWHNGRTSYHIAGDGEEWTLRTAPDGRWHLRWTQPGVSDGIILSKTMLGKMEGQLTRFKLLGVEEKQTLEDQPGATIKCSRSETTIFLFSIQMLCVDAEGLVQFPGTVFGAIRDCIRLALDDSANGRMVLADATQRPALTQMLHAPRGKIGCVS